MKLVHVFAVTLLVALNACSHQAQSQATNTPPSWVQSIINTDTTKSLNSSVQEIWQISHRGKTAFFVVSPCCDQYNPLYDDKGQIVCNPSGGITGRGDGKCPTPADAGSTPLLIWSHPQSQIKQHDASYLIDSGKPNSPTTRSQRY